MWAGRFRTHGGGLPLATATFDFLEIPAGVVRHLVQPAGQRAVRGDSGGTLGEENEHALGDIFDVLLAVGAQDATGGLLHGGQVGLHEMLERHGRARGGEVAPPLAVIEGRGWSGERCHGNK